MAITKIFMQVIHSIPAATATNSWARTGTTGYIGGDALYVLNKAHPEFQYTALVRNSEKGAQVASQYPSVRLVYGTLDDSQLLSDESAAADIVIRTYSLQTKPQLA
jgi:N-acetyl-gamma-glutamylphosphate reductase